MKIKNLWSAILLSLALVICSGCTSTITPKKVVEAQPSFDGNLQNSGFLGFTNHCGIITANARARYLSLVAFYGGRFEPRLVFDEGLTPYTNGTFLIDKQHLTDFGQMSLWKRSGVR